MKKEYKVVCSKTRFNDEASYIDIAPSKGIIHDQIFFSRILLHRSISSQPLDRLFGSIYLQDNNGDINILFPQEANKNKIIENQGILRQYSAIKEKIIQRYQKMIFSGKESTLQYICGINEMFDSDNARNSEAEAYEKRCRKKREQITEETNNYYKNKHLEQIYPKSFQEEQHIYKQQELKRTQIRRICCEQKRAQETIPSWLKFQKEYSGD